MKTVFNYYDGSGNQYTIEQDSIEYHPVKPKFSSSGIYDGGEHVKKAITRSQYEIIVSAFNKVLTDEISHVKNRVKGSGMIKIREVNCLKSCIIPPNSRYMAEIERLLNDLI